MSKNGLQEDLDAKYHKLFDGIREVTDDCRHHETARIVVVNPRAVEACGNIAVVCAGTLDIPVAEKAAVTATSTTASTLTPFRILFRKR